jgi:hypothetical protein
MTIRFKGLTMPSNEELLEQAAGVGIEFTPGSLEEFQFLQFCYTLWMHGSDSGIMRFKNALNQPSTNRQPMVEPMV